MGLDMYLRKKVYVGANYEHNEVTGTIDLYRGGKPIPIPLNKVVTIELDCAYWRKANHIHQWFVENVQQNNDDCGEYYVSVENIEKLISLCKRVLADHSLAEELLPTQPGFFFGGTEYDEYYFSDLEDTIRMLSSAIEDISVDTSADYCYQSSW